MFLRCLMSHGRRLTTASSHEHQTKFKTYLNRTALTTYHSHLQPLTPYKQLLVFRSLTTGTPPNHEDAKRKDSDSVETNSKGSEQPPAGSSSVETDSVSLDDWMKDIYDGQVMELLGIVVMLRFVFMLGKMIKKKYEDKKHVIRDEDKDGYLKYEVTGFRGAYDKSMIAEIRNSRPLVVSGRTYKSDGSSVAIERHITLPNNDYTEENKRATFYLDVGLLVVEISDFKKVDDIKIEVKDAKA